MDVQVKVISIFVCDPSRRVSKRPSSKITLTADLRQVTMVDELFLVTYSAEFLHQVFNLHVQPVANRRGFQRARVDDKAYTEEVVF